MISRLYNDHNRFRKILNLLEILLIGLCRKKTTDYRIMHNLVVYIQEYPEQAHHPLEDELFSVLIKSGVNESNFITNLIKDHTEIERITRVLREVIENNLHGKVSNIDQLITKLSNFISKQRLHLITEEMTLFPLVESTLTQHECEVIEATYMVEGDDAFGLRTDKDYELLERKLESMIK